MNYIILLHHPLPTLYIVITDESSALIASPVSTQYGCQCEIISHQCQQWIIPSAYNICAIIFEGKQLHLTPHHWLGQGTCAGCYLCDDMVRQWQDTSQVCPHSSHEYKANIPFRFLLYFHQTIRFSIIKMFHLIHTRVTMSASWDPSMNFMVQDQVTS